jgi:hypothetical protein
VIQVVECLPRKWEAEFKLHYCQNKEKTSVYEGTSEGSHCKKPLALLGLDRAKNRGGMRKTH